MNPPLILDLLLASLAINAYQLWSHSRRHRHLVETKLRLVGLFCAVESAGFKARYGPDGWRLERLDEPPVGGFPDGYRPSEERKP